MTAVEDLKAEADAIRDAATTLQASVGTLQTDVTAVLAAIAALVAAQGTNNDADIEAAVAELKDAGTALSGSNDAVTKAGNDLTAAIPPSAPPAAG